VPAANGARPLRVLQITDSHLFGAADGSLLGLATRETFEAVLALALGAGGPADALAMTGDLVHDETPEGYVYLERVLAATGLPCFCIPGNHDRPDLMDRYLGPLAMEPVAARRLGGWSLIFLDSTVRGSEGGHLGPERLRQLAALLEAEPAPTLVLLHQHPMPVGSVWMDTMGVDDGEALLAICDRHPQVKAVLYGHVHQEVRTERRGYPVLGAPSTCIQFVPGSEDFALDGLTPGYRELLLHGDGRLETRVLRLAAYPRPLNLQTSGY
jgi:Icc protein